MIRYDMIVVSESLWDDPVALNSISMHNKQNFNYPTHDSGITCFQLVESGS